MLHPFIRDALWLLVALASGVYAPGYLMVRALRLRLDGPEHLAVTLGGGMALLTGLYWTLSLLDAQAMLTGCVVLLTLVALLVRLIRKTGSRVSVSHEVLGAGGLCGLALLCLATMVSQGRFMLTSGWLTPQGMTLVNANAHDAPWHIYNLDQLVWRYPPEMPGFAGLAIPNYHIFADLFWAAIIRLAPVDPWRIYFHSAPLFHALVLALAVFIVAREWTGDSAAAALAVVMTGLLSNFGYVLPLVLGADKYPAWDSIFWTQPPMSMILNPGVSASFVLFALGLWALVRWLHDDEQRHRLLPVLGLTWGLIGGFKIYAAVLVVAGLAVAGAFRAIFVRDRRLLVALLAVLPLTLAVFAAFYRRSANLVVLLPGFNLATMLTLPGWMGMLSPGALAGMFERSPALVALIMAVLIPVFVIGNLGVRCLAMVPMTRAVLRPCAATPELLFVTVVSGGALAAAILFIQVGATFNTVQFFYYPILLAAIPAAQQFRRWTACRPRIAQTVLIGALVALGLPGSVHSWLRSPMVRFRFVIPPGEWVAYSWIRSNSEPKDVILRPPPPEWRTQEGFDRWLAVLARGRLCSLDDWRRFVAEGGAATLASSIQPATRTGPMEMNWGDAAYVAAACGRNTYLEDTLSVSLQITDGELERRARDVRAFYGNSDAAKARAMLDSAGIEFVVEDTAHPLPFAPREAGLMLGFENPTVRVWRRSGKLSPDPRLGVGS